MRGQSKDIVFELFEIVASAWHEIPRMITYHMAIESDYDKQDDEDNV